jgi:cell division protein FtsW
MKRADRSLFTNWWFQIDWRIFGLLVAFSFIGILAGIHSVHLLDKMLMFYAAAAIVFLFVPMFPKKMIIGISWALLAACLILFVITYASPHSIHNSLRWAYVFGFSFMPADLMKPAFIVLTAWFLTRAKKIAPDDFIGDRRVWRNGMWPTYLILFSCVLAAMFFHPDLGNMFMYLLTFGALVFWADAKIRHVLAICGFGLGGAVLFSFAHLHFLTRMFGRADPFQQNQSLNAIMNGGLWGRGEESFLFDRVPMENNDFVFATLAEMWGTVPCAVMLGAMFVLFSLLFKRSVESRDTFSSLAIFGAAFIFALHVAMNVLTAVGLFMKGTTLPFISYGGSSLLAFSLLFAIVLALVRIDKWGSM